MSINFKVYKAVSEPTVLKKKWREDKRMIYLRLALYEKLLRRTDGTGHGYLLYYSIHFCACLKFSIIIHLKTVYFLLEQSLLQQHNSKASVLQGSAFFMVQFSHPSVTTGKTIALTIWIFVGKVMSLLFNMLSMSCHGFPRSKHFLISWLQSPSAVIFEPKETKPVTASTIRHWHSKIFKAKQKLTLNWLSHKQHPDLNSL